MTALYRRRASLMRTVLRAMALRVFPVAALLWSIADDR